MAELPVSDLLEQFGKRASNGKGIDMSKQGIEHCVQDWRVPFPTSVLSAYEEIDDSLTLPTVVIPVRLQHSSSTG